MAVQEQSKTSRIKRTFRNEGSSEPTPRAKLDTTHITFTVENGKFLELSLAELFGGTLPPASVGRAAAAAGVSNVIGGAGLADGVKTDDPDAIMEAMNRRASAFKAGDWTAEREGGGRPSMVWQAFVAWRTERKADVSEAKLKSLHVEWFNNEAKFKSLLINDQFAPYLAAYKAKHGKAKEAASTGDLLA